MLVTCVTVTVVPEHVDAFIEATLANHAGSVTEPGNLRFDVLRRRDEPHVFTLYEAWVDEAAAKAHKETAHYKLWRDTVSDWMAEPRVGLHHDVVAPLVGEAW